MNLQTLAKQNRIKALTIVEQKKRAMCTPRPEVGLKRHLPTFRSARFDFGAPYVLT